jgi:hypothetical protein
VTLTDSDNADERERLRLGFRKIRFHREGFKTTAGPLSSVALTGVGDVKKCIFASEGRAGVGNFPK